MRKNRGFTLVELVVVVLILGILAAIAAPKIINNSDDARESAAAQTLAAIRDAIELYATQADAGGYPSGTSDQVKSKLDSYLRGSTFPKPGVGATTVANSNVIKPTSASPIVSATPDNTTGWLYNSTTGEFVINSNASDSNSVPFWQY